MKKIRVKLKEWYDCTFDIYIKDDVKLEGYRYINFSKDESLKKLLNFYRYEIMQGEKITSINGRRHIEATGYFDNKKRYSWKDFENDFLPVVLYNYCITYDIITIDPIRLNCSQNKIDSNYILSV